MSKIQLSEKICSTRYEYHLISSVNTFSNEIVSSLFKDGVELFAKKKSYSARWSEDKLTRQIQHEHHELKAKIQRLVELMKAAAAATNPRMVNVAAQAFFDYHFTDEALDLLNDFVGRHTQADSCFFRLGLFNYQLKYFSDATSCFQQAVGLKPDYADYRNWLGKSLLEAGKYEESINVFLKATRINVYFAEGYLNCGLAWLQQGKSVKPVDEMLSKRVQSALESACKLQPVLQNQQMSEIFVAVKKQEWEQAADKMKELIARQQTQNPMVIVERFWIQCLLTQNQLPVSEIHDHIKILSRQIQLHPGYADLNDALGIAYSMLGISYLQEADPFFRTAMQRNPQFFAAHRHQKLIRNELRGLRLLVDSLQDLSPEAPETRQKKMRISMS